MMKRSNGSGWSKAARTGAVLLMCIAGAVGSSCGKKAPPPKPAPPPPPPPPPQAVEVSFDSISQDMKADARVQFAPDLKLEDEEVARAIITLADAWAKGDTDAIGRVVSKSSRTAIDGVRDLGGFSGENQAEAVRVVSVAKNDESTGFKRNIDEVFRWLSGGEGGTILSDSDLAQLVVVMTAAIKRVDPKFDGATIAPPFTADKRGKIVEAWERLKGDDQHKFAVDVIKASFEAANSIPGLGAAEYVVLIAVQTPKGVELTGWGLEKAFGKWTFNNASTDSQVKKSASEWDGVGLAGFSRDSSEGIKVIAAKTEDGEKKDGGETTSTDEKTDGEKKDGEQKDEPGKQPDEKRTPHGPVKIPGGG